MTSKYHPAIKALTPLDFPWPVDDPFLFCAYHQDIYPRANEEFGPDADLSGRNLGSDFIKKDGYRMYHGETVPGFPAHPHCGFETLTIVEEGFVDHTDSLGATARYGKGDFQWLTTGSGILHSEMFPLLNKTELNPLELFQIWLNLPARSKESPAAFNMYWAEKFTHFDIVNSSHLKVFTGQLGHYRASITPPQASYASSEKADLTVAVLTLAKGEQFNLPKAHNLHALRSLYFYMGNSVKIGDVVIDKPMKISLDSSFDQLPIIAIDGEVKLLLLQGVPLYEPIVQHGPFVALTKDRLYEKINEYRRTEFGGWTLPTSAPVHGEITKRFAKRGEETEWPS
ncbi:pirin family protein [Thorsellia kenyensis]|uniref:Pirin family protein n=1 Tax=Thorsellia kenyensis TaxID=1549888 RepID=A0ABV6CCI0_9GAMM